MIIQRVVLNGWINSRGRTLHTSKAAHTLDDSLKLYAFRSILMHYRKYIVASCARFYEDESKIRRLMFYSASYNVANFIH